MKKKNDPFKNGPQSFYTKGPGPKASDRLKRLWAYLVESRKEHLAAFENARQKNTALDHAFDAYSKGLQREYGK